MDLWNPRGLLSAVDPEPPVTIAAPPGERTLIASADAERIALYAWSEPLLASEMSISPFASGTSDGIRPFDGQTHVAILSAQYPFYCQGEWYAVNAGVVPYNVIVSSLRRRG